MHGSWNTLIPELASWPMIRWEGLNIETRRAKQVNGTSSLHGMRTWSRRLGESRVKCHLEVLGSEVEVVVGTTTVGTTSEDEMGISVVLIQVIAIEAHHHRYRHRACMEVLLPHTHPTAMILARL